MQKPSNRKREPLRSTLIKSRATMSKVILIAVVVVIVLYGIKESRKSIPIECEESIQSESCDCEKEKELSIETALPRPGVVPGSKPTEALLPRQNLQIPPKNPNDYDQLFEAHSDEIAKVSEICKGNKIFEAECIARTKDFSVGQLAELAGTDEFWVASKKNTVHYVEAYETFFSNKNSQEKLTVLEIGVKNGNSLRLWQRLFPNAQVVGMDIKIDGIDLPPTIKLIQGDIKKAADLQALCGQFENLKVIVEDSTHNLDDSIFAFKILFPCLADGGIYVIEDTMYECVKGQICDIYRKGMEFFTNFIYGISLQEGQSKLMNISNPIQTNMFAAHFYPHLLFFQKKAKKI